MTNTPYAAGSLGPAPYQSHQLSYPGPSPSPRRGTVPTNGLAIASLVLGILWVYSIGSILALVFGYMALGQIKQRQDAGRGLALAGIVLGWVGIAVGVLSLVGLLAVQTH